MDAFFGTGSLPAQLFLNKYLQPKYNTFYLPAYWLSVVRPGDNWRGIPSSYAGQTNSLPSRHHQLGRGRGHQGGGLGQQHHVHILPCKISVCGEGVFSYLVDIACGVGGVAGVVGDVRLTEVLYHQLLSVLTGYKLSIPASNV